MCHCRAMRMFCRTITMLVFTLLPTIAWAVEADDKTGEAISRQHCSRCHVVPNYNTMGIGSTPSFKAMVQSPAKDWRHKFEAFFSLPPHGTFVRIKEYRQITQTPSAVAPIVISLDDLDHLMAYIDRLAAELRTQ